MPVKIGKEAGYTKNIGHISHAKVLVRPASTEEMLATAPKARCELSFVHSAGGVRFSNSSPTCCNYHGHIHLKKA
jgi:hypothetical protein